jgi:hypothetical protein
MASLKTKIAESFAIRLCAFANSVVATKVKIPTRQSPTTSMTTLSNHPSKSNFLSF